jgi:PilZ domain
MMPIVNNRASVRRTPTSDETYVHIMDWAGERISKARLLDVSLGGALISTYTLVATGQKVRLQFDRAPEIGWIDAEAVHVKRPRKVGVRFERPLRPEFVVAATSEERSKVEGPEDQETFGIDANTTIDWAPSSGIEQSE